jgi:hypothetical protein
MLDMALAYYPECRQYVKNGRLSISALDAPTFIPLMAKYMIKAYI